MTGPQSDRPRLTSRRDALAAFGLGAAGLGALGPAGAAIAGPLASASITPEELGWDPARKLFTLPPLPYPKEALEPHLDATTVELHHDRHHAGYVSGLNVALRGLDQIRNYITAAIQMKQQSHALAFNLSGHLLHCVYWNCMGPDGGGEPEGALARRIASDFTTFKQFSFHFEEAAAQVEGSGWAILGLEPISGQLMIVQAEKHQNVAVWGLIPLLAIDVWEHAYYLTYQNRRKDYIKAFFEVINWDWVGRRYTMAANLE